MTKARYQYLYTSTLDPSICPCTDPQRDVTIANASSREERSYTSVTWRCTFSGPPPISRENIVQGSPREWRDLFLDANITQGPITESVHSSSNAAPKAASTSNKELVTIVSFRQLIRAAH